MGNIKRSSEAKTHLLSNAVLSRLAALGSTGRNLLGLKKAQQGIKDLILPKSPELQHQDALDILENPAAFCPLPHKRTYGIILLNHRNLEKSM